MPGSCRHRPGGPGDRVDPAGGLLLFRARRQLRDFEFSVPRGRSLWTLAVLGGALAGVALGVDPRDEPRWSEGNGFDDAFRDGLAAESSGGRKAASITSDVLLGMHVWETTSKDNVLYILNHLDFEKFQPMKFFILRGKDTLYGHLPVSLHR